MGSHEYFITFLFRKPARLAATSAGWGEGKQEGLGWGWWLKSLRKGEFTSARLGVRLDLGKDGQIQSLRPRDCLRLGESPRQSFHAQAPGRPGREAVLRSQEAAVPGIARICGSHRGESVEQGWRKRKGKAGRDEERQGRRRWRPYGIPHLGAFPGLKALMAAYVTELSAYTSPTVFLHLLLLTDSSTESSQETAFPPRCMLGTQSSQWSFSNPHNKKTAGGK